MTRLKSIWVPTLVGVSCFASLSVGAIIRREFPLGQGRWLLPSAVYITHGEHFGNARSWGVALGVILILFFIGGLRFLNGVDLASRMTTAALALIVGGSLSNTIEIFARGSVTDWLGIHATNGAVYSGGDISLGVAISIIPTAGLAAVAPPFGKTAGFITWVSLLVVLLLLGFAIPHAAGLVPASAATAILTLAWVLVRHAYRVTATSRRAARRL